MPELPEVEVLRLSLEPVLLGRTLRSVEVRFPTLREPLDKKALERDVAGRKVVSLRRRSKYLLVDLETKARGPKAPGTTLVVHLGMSGRLTVVQKNAPRVPHEHVNFALDRNQRIRYSDPRRFGLVFSQQTEALEQDRHFVHLGVEPLEAGFDGEYLARLASKSRVNVKTFIMDARRVVGVGNIYACEALFLAGIHPNRSVARIAKARFDGLAKAIKQVLSRAIEEGGTTLNDYQNGLGEEGYFQVSLAVYGRAGEPCTRCGAAVRRMVHANRSTFYCGKCQR